METTLIPSIEDFQILFSNDLLLPILVCLSQQEKMKASATQIASILEIHITTAKKYLDILNKYNFVKRKVVLTQQGKPTYYTLMTKQIQICLDLVKLAESLQSKIPILNVAIREKKNIYPRVTYIFGREGQIKTIKIKKRTKARRSISQHLKLSDTEAEFMKFVPHPTMKPEPFLNICSRINVQGKYAQKSLFLFVQKLTGYRVLEVFSNGNEEIEGS